MVDGEKEKDGRPINEIWGRELYSIGAGLKPERDQDLIEGIPRAQEKLQLRTRADTVRVLVGIARLDVFSEIPQDAGGRIGAFCRRAREHAEAYQAAAAEQTANETDQTDKTDGDSPDKVKRNVGARASASADAELYVVCVIYQVVHQLDSTADANRSVLRHGLELLDRDDPRVPTFMEAFHKSFTEKN